MAPLELFSLAGGDRAVANPAMPEHYFIFACDRSLAARRASILARAFTQSGLRGVDFSSKLLTRTRTIRPGTAAGGWWGHEFGEGPALGHLLDGATILWTITRSPVSFAKTDSKFRFQNFFRALRHKNSGRVHGPVFVKPVHEPSAEEFALLSTNPGP